MNQLPSMYGDEEKLVPPSELFDEADAQSALDKATEVLASRQMLIQGATAPKPALSETTPPENVEESAHDNLQSNVQVPG